MLRRGGPYLPLKEINRKPFIKTRITRCFFSPTNRPPKNGEELADEIDYYPEEYLNRLAHEGINGIWIYTKFKDLLPSSVIPEFGKDYRKRIDKLNKIIAKCRKYGIKVYIFGVEPGSTYWNPELLQLHKELLGQHWGDDIYAMCLGNEKGKKYAEEATKTLFTLAPGLGGLIVISVGESNSHCASGSDTDINCPTCIGKEANQILADAESILAKGMHSVKPEAEFISWRYGQRTWGKEKVIDSASNIGSNTILMQNFEDLGEEEQLGRKRLAIDYFLSYAGPSEMFAESAKAARSAGRRVFAKLQVCCSHEVASVPYIPVPGILYAKYKAMRELGVDGAMQCWYFGNYPSVMNKAAGELSFEPFFKDENAFLNHLSGIYWGEENENIVQAWKHFAEGYKNFPINVAFTWYGPMHDAVVWPLQLIPKNMSLASTWLTYEAVGGDRIGECLLNGHDLDEAIILCDIMSSNWKKGTALLKQTDEKKQNAKENQKSVSFALDCQFESGLNILRFYRLREFLGAKAGGGMEYLEEMRSIVEREIEISKMLKKLCEKDKRLGYHSEAEGYKYFPEKLEWRIRELHKLLETEFLEVAERIENGKAALAYYFEAGSFKKRYALCSGTPDNALWENLVFEDQTVDNDTKWRAVTDKKNIQIYIRCRNMRDSEYIRLRSEFRPMWPYPVLIVGSDGKKDLALAFYFSLYRETLEKELAKWNVSVFRDKQGLTAIITIRKSDFMPENTPRFKLNIERAGIQVSKWVFSGNCYSSILFSEDHNEFGIVEFRDAAEK